MLGVRGLQHGRVRRHRAAAPDLHGRQEAAADAEEQHQLPPRAVPEADDGHDEEQLSGRLLDDGDAKRNTENGGHREGLYIQEDSRGLEWWNDGWSFRCTMGDVDMAAAMVVVPNIWAGAMRLAS